MMNKITSLKLMALVLVQVSLTHSQRTLDTFQAEVRISCIDIFCMTVRVGSIFKMLEFTVPRKTIAVGVPQEVTYQI